MARTMVREVLDETWNAPDSAFHSLSSFQSPPCANSHAMFVSKHRTSQRKPCVSCAATSAHSCVDYVGCHGNNRNHSKFGSSQCACLALAVKLTCPRGKAYQHSVSATSCKGPGNSLQMKHTRKIQSYPFSLWVKNTRSLQTKT